MTSPRPYLSVIVPAHQGTKVLPRCLDALVASDIPRESWELIVVNDASTDDTDLIAAAYADTVVQLAGNPHGPAYARNRGFEVARGEILVFVDSDVCVHADALGKIAQTFATDPQLGAVFGSYDADPPAPGLVSQYRNLLHHFVHQRNAGEAETFWAGLGAIRREAFANVEGFNEWHFSRPQIEDVELGRRLRRHGYPILLRPDILGTHLKRWTLGNVLHTDFRHRGVPWMSLLLVEGPDRHSTLNLQFREKICTALAGVSLLGGGLALVLRSLIPLLVGVAAVVAIVGLNHAFYRFLRRQKGLLFASGVVPLHWGYYASNGFSVISGWLTFVLLGEPQVPPASEALASIGAETWPPVPKRPRKSSWDQHVPPVE